MLSVSRPIRILVIGSQKLFAHTRRRLTVAPAFEVFEPQHGNNFVSAVQQIPSHVVLLDVAINELRQRLITRAVTEMEFPPHLVAISPVYEPFLSAIDPSVFSGSLLTRLVDTPLLSLVLSGIANGYTYFVPPPAIARDYLFDEDELRVLRLLAIGLDTVDLIEALGHKREGIYYIQRKIRRKLGTNTIQQAVVLAIQNGIVTTLIRPEAERIA